MVNKRRRTALVVLTVVTVVTEVDAAATAVAASAAACAVAAAAMFEVVVRQLTLVEGSRQIGPFYNFTSPILHFRID